MKRTRILIADDHAVVRAGLKLILAGEHDFDLVGEAATGEEAVDKAVSLRPDVVLLDIAMPGMSGLDAGRLIRERAPDVRIVILTMYDDEAYLRQFLEIGAAGYVLKTTAHPELVEAIRAAQRGEPFVDPALTRQLMELYRKRSLSPPSPPSPQEDELPDLSPRETEVLRLVALGHTSQQIADQLCVSVSTVESHRAHFMKKLGLKGRAQAVQYALSKGLLEEPGR